MPTGAARAGGGHVKISDPTGSARRSQSDPGGAQSEELRWKSMGVQTFATQRMVVPLPPRVQSALRDNEKGPAAKPPGLWVRRQATVIGSVGGVHGVVAEWCIHEKGV